MNAPESSSTNPESSSTTPESSTTTPVDTDEFLKKEFPELFEKLPSGGTTVTNAAVEIWHNFMEEGSQ